MMSESGARPLCFDDAVEEMAISIVDTHDGIVLGKGFNPGFSEVQYREQVERVTSVLYPVFCTVYGDGPETRFADVFEQVSTFAEHLAKDHIFPDANKRTTVVFSLTFLGKAGFGLDAVDASDPSDNVLYAWIQDVVSGDKSLGQLADDLRARSKPLGD